MLEDYSLKVKTLICKYTSLVSLKREDLLWDGVLMSPTKYTLVVDASFQPGWRLKADKKMGSLAYFKRLETAIRQARATPDTAAYIIKINTGDGPWHQQFTVRLDEQDYGKLWWVIKH